MSDMFITHASLKARHGFFTRNGGVSGGLFASLNCGVSRAGERENALENRRLAMSALGVPPESLSVLNQTHSSMVLTVDAPVTIDMNEEGDAQVTRTRGITLGVVTADCAPVLLHDPVAGVIGAAHSGWRGTLGFIAPATVMVMEKLGANRRNITAVIGPCIEQRSYEVSPDFPAPFIARDREEFFKPSPKAGHFLFNLKGCIAHDLQTMGVGEVITLPHDTYEDKAHFFSNRRATHRSEAGFGLQLSAISLD